MGDCDVPQQWCHQVRKDRSFVDTSVIDKTAGWEIAEHLAHARTPSVFCPLIPSSVVVSFFFCRRFIDFCHDCGDLDRLREKAVDAFYPSPTDKHYENANSEQHLESLIPDLTKAISTHLTHQVNHKYRHDSGHCLYHQDLSVFFEMATSTPKSADQCT